MANENDNNMEGWGRPRKDEEGRQEEQLKEQPVSDATPPEDEEEQRLKRAEEKAKKYNINWFETFKQLFKGIKSTFGNSKLTFGERREKVEGKELDYDTTDEMSKKRNSAFKKRMVYVIVLGPLVMLVFIGIIKGIFKYQELQEQERENAKIAAKMHSDRMDLGADAMKDTWKTTFEYKNGLRNKEVDKKFADINKSQKDTLSAVMGLKEELVNITKKAQVDMARDLNDTVSNLQDNLQEFKTSIESDIEKTKKDFNKKLVEQANKKPAYPSRGPVAQKKSNESFLPLPWDRPDSANANMAPAVEEDVIVEEEVSEELAIGQEAGSTLEFFSSEDSNETLLEFVLRAGFAKGRLVTGADSKTLEYGAKNPEPIYISMMSPILISNDYIEDISDCLLIGTIQGEFSTSRAKIRLSKLSCTMESADGDMYMVDQKVDGWVFGEDGQVGAKGRLITKEGKIVSKALPLGMLEGLIGALTQSPQLLVPGSVGTGATAVEQGALTGFSSGSTKVIEKISDYYIKLLDSLNPTVEVRMGRTVTVGFKGGEVIKVKPYRNVNVGAFAELSEGGVNEAYISN